MKKSSPFARIAASLGLLLAPAAPAATSQGAGGTGVISGHVQDSTTGDYLKNARVTVRGTGLAALTDEFGEYRLTEVPAGEVQVNVFYSGLPAQSAAVSLASGQRVVRDFEMKSTAVQLQAFTVQAEKLSEAALAVNEQRFAPNVKTVLAADQFGDQSEGNVAEFLKFMPGVAVSYVEQDARSISVRGMPTYTTVITSNGNPIASGASGNTRGYEFEQTTINDLSQIEFNKTLLPDMPAEGIGGTINLVTKSAFMRSRPQISYRTYLNFNTTRMELERRYGPSPQKEFLIRPGFDFTYIKPVNKDFGFTLSGGLSSKYNPQYILQDTWTLNPAPGTGIESPFLRTHLLQDTPKLTNRSSARISVDWRFTPQNVISVGYAQNIYDAYWNGRRWIPDVGATPASFSPAHVLSRPNAGSGVMNGNVLHKFGTTWSPEFKYNFHGSVWKVEARGSYSHASNHQRTGEKGHFQNANLSFGSINAAGVFVAPTVRFDYTGNYVPVVTAFDHNGAPLDAKNVDNYYLNFGRADRGEVSDERRSAAIHAQRNFDLGFPARLKVGGDVRQFARDRRFTSDDFNFVGADGRARTADDSGAALGLLEEGYSKVNPPFGQDRFRWVDLYKIWRVYEAHPTWFVRNLATEHNTLVNGSNLVDEEVSSAFVRFDASFFQNRINVIAGVRMQDYRVRAESGEVNSLGRYLRDDEGNPILNPAGQPIVGTGSALDVAERSNIERGVLTKGRTRGYYPSFNASVRLREDLQLRLGYAESVNYPEVSQVAAQTTITDVTAVPRRVTANSPLKPWFGKNYDIDLEYYTPHGGTVVVSFFRKEITDFIRQARYLAGTPEARAALDKYGYGGLAALNFEVIERLNGGDAVYDGWDLDLRQTLDAYVPTWARGFNVFFNTSYTAAPRGVNAADISAQSTRLMNWGVNYQRHRFSARLKWNHVPEPKRVTPNITHPVSRTFLDLDLSYRLRERITLFASGANVMSVASGNYIYTDNTPDYARRGLYGYYGVQCTIGLKGQF